MKIVFLDSNIINPGDISWEPLMALGDLTIFPRTAPEERVRHMGDAEAVFVDSVSIDRETIEACKQLKFIGVAATGYNHIDVKAAREHSVAVCNVPAYSTEAVAQHTIALLLAITNRVDVYNEAIAQGDWHGAEDYTFMKGPLTLLAGKSLGIIGYGNIGKQVANISKALGMTVHVYSRNKEKTMKSDVLSLHCPLTPENAKMVNRDFIAAMKDGAILINTARGGLIDEEALAEGLKSGKLMGAGLDVLSEEPPQKASPLMGLENCYITPHIGFIPKETRKIAMDTCADNLKSFIEGNSHNRIV